MHIINQPMKVAGRYGTLEDACRDHDLSTDFLISALAAAALHYRRASVCIPFPKAFEAGGIRDYQALKECIQSLPSVDSLSRTDAAQTLSSQQIQLLEWLLLGPSGRIPSNFSPISLQEFSREVPQSMLGAISAANPSLLPQLILKVHPPEETNKKSTSIDNNVVNKRGKEELFAYHGTSFENIHSILSTGLINLSGTRLERTGAVFGQGIYLSTDLSVAFAFCNPADAWTSSRIGSRLRCLLFCGISGKNTAESCSGALENNNAKVLLKGAVPAAPEQVIVVERSDVVSIRYLLVYADTTHSIAPLGSVSHAARGGAVERSAAAITRGSGLSFFPLVIGIFLSWLLVVSTFENWPWIRRALRRNLGW